MMTWWNEFKAFLLKQNVIALAIAVVVGAATNNVVQGIVNDFIMPVIGVVQPAGRWEETVLRVGSVIFRVGHFASVLFNFLIVAVVTWQLSKMFIKPQSNPATRPCPFCKMQIDAAATRCPHCTSQLAA